MVAILSIPVAGVVLRRMGCGEPGRDEYQTFQTVRTSDGQTRFDRATLDALAAQGADLSTQTEVIHDAYFSNKGAADELASELANEGFRVSLEGRPSGLWRVAAAHDLVPSLATIGKAREHVANRARRRGGDYDGWEAAVTR
jgi:hypothetical protein